MEKIFITGGAGFIGSSFISRMIRYNHIFVYDNLSRNSLADMNHPHLRIIQGDILDFDFLKRSIPEDTDVVINMAAVAGVDTVIKNPIKTMEVNSVGTYYLLEALRERELLGIRKFINFSTSEVFGINAFHADEESSINLQPVGEARWTYSVSKLFSEHLVHAYHEKLGLRSVNIRPFNIYGPGQIGEGAIHYFILKAIKDEPLIVHGEGDQIRSWCYIDDMIDGLILCLDKNDAVGNVFNIGNPAGTITVRGLAEKIVQLSESSSPIHSIPKNYVDVDLRIPSIDKSRRILGYSPKVDLNIGIMNTIRWYRSKNEK